MNLRYHAPLSPGEQLAHGLAAPQPLAMADRVRYAEIDRLDHVNNKAYMSWFETLRVEYFDRFCAPFWGDRARPRTVLRNAEIRFFREMLMGESYIATARVVAFRRASYTIEQQLWSGDMRARFDGVMVMLRPDGGGRDPLPAALCRRFVAVDGAKSQT